jgi:vacuolar-type H+-ATPase subunit I/STV1
MTVLAQGQEVNFADVLVKIILPISTVILGGVFIIVQMLERKIKEVKDDLKDLRDTIDKRVDRLQADSERKTESLQTAVEKQIDKQDAALRSLEKSLADVQSRGSAIGHAVSSAPYLATSGISSGASPTIVQTPDPTLLGEVARVLGDTLTRATEIMGRADAAERETLRRQTSAEDAARRAEAAREGAEVAARTAQEAVKKQEGTVPN